MKNRTGFGLLATAFYLALAVLIVQPGLLQAAAKAGIPPKISLNGRPGNVTIQDLSGLGTRPLRLLVNKNNQLRGADFIQTFALGVNEGDDFVMDLDIRQPGTRVTVYKIFQSPGGPRYLSMPLSEYFPEATTGKFRERIEPFDEEVMIVVFEKTDSQEDRSVQVRYFEERVRKLVVASYETNLVLSSMKLKMRDLNDTETSEFFESDGQLLIDRLENPERIFLVRLWTWEKRPKKPASKK
jgi:hypothetical protein